MIHWPDSMFTYVPEDGILFSSDGFGQHYAGPERFDDEIGERIMAHAKKYFANILLLYATHIEKLIRQVAEMKLDLRMICPDHGVIWRRDPSRIVQAYLEWCAQQPQQKAVVVYDTMWHSTERMAEAIHAGITAEGVVSMPMNLRAYHRSEIMTEIFDARAVVVGSPTLNNGLFPTVADFLCYLRGLKPRHKIGAAFGSGRTRPARAVRARETRDRPVPRVRSPDRPGREGRHAGCGLRGVRRMKRPVVELSECIRCDVCVEACPAVFRRNQAGYIEVADLDAYPADEVDDAIRNCPADCIRWEEE
jgi:ferredoxin